MASLPGPLAPIPGTTVSGSASQGTSSGQSTNQSASQGTSSSSGVSQSTGQSTGVSAAQSTNQAVGESTNQAVGQGTSASTSFNLAQPAQQFQNAWQQTLSALQNQSYQWAQDQAASNQGLTDATVNNYLSGAGAANNTAAGALNQYGNIYQPLNSQFAQEAQTYANPNFVQQQQGAAEAGSQQASAASMANLQQQLQGMGIDPSSPRYAGALAAANTQAGAGAAGAGQQSALATQATGLALQQAAIQQGQQVGAMGLSGLNVGYQGQAGAENAALANTQTSGAMLGTSPTYAGLGVQGTTFAPLANTSTSQNTNQAVGQSTNLSTGQSTSDSQNQSTNDATSANQANSQNTASSSGQSTNQSQNTGSSASGPMMGPTLVPGPGAGMSAAGGAIPDRATLTSMNAAPMSAYSMGGFVNSGGTSRPSMGIPMPPQSTIGATTGGFVSRSLSPSDGANTDDIPAKLNADEFVIPRDVTHWNGQKFYQDHIRKSREDAAKGTTAKPTVKTMTNPKQAAQHMAANNNQMYGGGRIGAI